jgi:hypothetical protein
MTGNQMQVTWPKPNRRFGPFDILGLIGLGGLFVARFIPVAKIIPFWGCMFRRVTGYPCPGCGLTRAADHFAHLHWLTALKSNPLGTLAALLFAICAVWTVLHLLFKVPFPEVELSDREWRAVRYVAIVAFVLNYAFVVVQHRFPGLLWG